MGELAAIIAASKKLVFFGGAGVSTESGIPDFRSADGLFRTDSGTAIPPERVLSRSFFMQNPEEFYRYYKTHLIHSRAKPNNAHLALAALERDQKLSCVITQNIDGLHQVAGSDRVLELHGSCHRNYCMWCEKRFGLDAIVASEGVPRCDCGGLIRPDVVLYEEQLDSIVVDETLRELTAADTLIVGGTSLAVYPAAGFLRAFRGTNLVLINKDPTPYDAKATLVLHTSIGDALAPILGANL